MSEVTARRRRNEDGTITVEVTLSPERVWVLDELASRIDSTLEGYVADLLVSPERHALARRHISRQDEVELRGVLDERIMKLYRRGHSDVYIADFLQRDMNIKLSRGTVRRWRQSHELSANQHGISTDRAARAAASAG